jgi:ankyrin repeat protein
MRYIEKGKDPSAVDSAGYTALHYAARLGYFDMVRCNCEADFLIVQRTNTNYDCM